MTIAPTPMNLPLSLHDLTVPYEHDGNVIRGFSRDFAFEYELRTGEQHVAGTLATTRLSELTVKRTGDSWGAPIALYNAGRWLAVPQNEEARAFVAILTNATSELP